MYIRGAMKIGWVAPVKASHPYLENGPATLFGLHHLRISPWFWSFNDAPRGLMSLKIPGLMTLINSLGPGLNPWGQEGQMGHVF